MIDIEHCLLRMNVQIEPREHCLQFQGFHRHTQAWHFGRRGSGVVKFWTGCLWSPTHLFWTSHWGRYLESDTFDKLPGGWHTTFHFVKLCRIASVFHSAYWDVNMVFSPCSKNFQMYSATTLISRIRPSGTVQEAMIMSNHLCNFEWRILYKYRTLTSTDIEEYEDTNNFGTSEFYDHSMRSMM